jgi:hypothetical protein
MPRLLKDYQVFATAHAALHLAVSNADLVNILRYIRPVHVDLRRSVLLDFAERLHFAFKRARFWDGVHCMTTLQKIRAELLGTWTGEALTSGLRDLLIVECYAIGMQYATVNLHRATETVPQHINPLRSNRCMPYFFPTQLLLDLAALPISHRAVFFEATHPMLGDVQFQPELRRFLREFEGQLPFISDGFAVALAEVLLVGTERRDLRCVLLRMGVTNAQLTRRIDGFIEAKLCERIAYGHPVPYAWCERWRPNNDHFLARIESHALVLHRKQIRRTRSWKELLATEGLTSSRIVVMVERLVRELEPDTIRALPQDPLILGTFLALHARTGSLDTNAALIEAYHDVGSAMWAMQPVLMDRLSSHLWRLLPSNDFLGTRRVRRLSLWENVANPVGDDIERSLHSCALHLLAEITAWREACVARCLKEGAPRLAARAYVAEISAWINLGDVIPDGAHRIAEAVSDLADRAFNEIPVAACGDLLDRLCRVTANTPLDIGYPLLGYYLEAFVANPASSACCPSMAFAQQIIAIAAKRRTVLALPSAAGMARFDQFCARYDLRNHDRDKAWHALSDHMTLAKAWRG